MEVEIARPSPAQMRKLHMGHPFRAKLGPGLKVSLPQKEAKKLMKASMKGSGATLSGCKCSGCGMCGNGIPPQLDPRNRPQSSSGQAHMGGNVKASAKGNAIRLMDAGTDRAVRALEGSGMSGGNVKKSAKKNSIRLMDAGTDRAVRALEGSGMGGGKVNRRNKFNKWFKAIGDKFKPIAKNVKPIKEAATQRAADFIKYYDNPEAQAQAALDMFQKEAGETADVFKKDKKRGQSQGSASVADYVPVSSAPAGLRRGTFIAPTPPPLPPQAVDVNDDGEADGYFYPNEMSWFGAGIPRGMKGMQGVRKTMRRSAKQVKQMGGMMGRPTTMPVVRPRPSLKASGAKKTSPWIAHVKAYCAQHGCKYSEGLKRAAATYKKGGALYPAGYDPRYDR
jgi:hypothetical protein